MRENCEDFACWQRDAKDLHFLLNIINTKRNINPQQVLKTSDKLLCVSKFRPPLGFYLWTSVGNFCNTGEIGPLTENKSKK